MLHATSNTRLNLVHLFLLFRERLIPITLLANHRHITKFLQPLVDILPHLRRVSKRLLIRIVRLLRHQVRVRLTVMNCGISNTITANQLKLIVDLTVILVTKNRFVPLLCPASITILLGEYIRIFRETLWDFTFRDLLVFVLSIALLSTSTKLPSTINPLFAAKPRASSISLKRSNNRYCNPNYSPTFV